MWPDVLDPSAVHEVRAMKARTEQMLARKGLETRELKRGYGGIRDIEFAVQLLQLVHGRHDHSIRARSTLDALEQLAGGGYITIADDAPTRRGVRVAAHGRAPAPTRRRAPDAHAPRRRRGAHAPRACSGSETGAARRRSHSSTPSISVTRRSCARSTRSCSSRRCSTRSPASARCRWRPRRNG